jgi:hypothetical protein
MPTLITQDEFEPELLLNPNLTMTIPAFATLPVAQITSNKLIQSGLWGQVAVLPAPETKSIQVQGYNPGSTKVQSHLHKINAKAHVNKKETKVTQSKKKTGNPKHSAFHNGQDDCKESVQLLAKSLQIQELMDRMNRNKK